MQFLTFTAFLAAAATFAAPVAVPDKAAVVLDDHSVCAGYQNAMVNVNESMFVVTIGRPYLGGKHAKGIRKAISANGFKVDSFKVKGAAYNKHTVLYIKSNMNGKNLAKVNEALSHAYPDITFSCPTKIYEE